MSLRHWWLTRKFHNVEEQIARIEAELAALRPLTNILAGACLLAYTVPKEGKLAALRIRKCRLEERLDGLNRTPRGSQGYNPPPTERIEPPNPAPPAPPPVECKCGQQILLTLSREIIEALAGIPPKTYICPTCGVDYKHKYGSCDCGPRGPVGHPGHPGPPTPIRGHREDAV